MAEIIAQATIVRVPLKVYMSDHVTEAPGKTVAVTISKNFGAFANPSAGATNATEHPSGDGWYYVDTSILDTGSVGPLIVRGTATGCDPSEALYTVAAAVVIDTGSVIASPVPTATTFSSSSTTLNAPTGGYTIAPMSVLWLSGANQGIKSAISVHTVTTGTHAFTVAALPTAPSSGDRFAVG